MLKTYICIVCPNGCEIQAEQRDDKTVSNVTGNLCEKGEQYVRQEVENPVRTIATSVLVHHGECPLASVRLTQPVPKGMIFQVMDAAKQITLEAPVQAGEVVIPHILGTDSDLIVTKSIKRK